MKLTEQQLRSRIRAELINEGIWASIKSMMGGAMDKISDILGMTTTTEHTVEVSDDDTKAIDDAEAQMLSAIKEFTSSVAGGLKNAGVEDAHVLEAANQTTVQILEQLIGELGS